MYYNQIELILKNENSNDIINKFLFLITNKISTDSCINISLSVSSFKYLSYIGLVKNLGKVLFSEFLFPFEIASVLLLAALVGAIMIGKKEIK